ncbi:MAG: amidohydrolase [Provencibacterium sp.]|nr:amidohydrolase [Provencibacterium sp.]
MKIIDAHVHLIHTLAGWGAQGELRACGGGKAVWSTGEVIQMIPPVLGENCVTPEAVVKLMDEHEVEKAVLLQGSYYGFQNEYTWEAMKRYPDRFVGAAAYDPFCLQRDRIRARLFDDHGFKIVKFEVSTGSGLMSYHGYVDLFGEEMQEAYRYADERGHVFVLDIGRKDAMSWQIEALRKAVLAHPGMIFVICHILAPRPGEEDALRNGLGRLALPNVWFDFAALAANQRPEPFPYPTAVHYLKIAKEILGADRLMFGSDLPSTACRDTYRHLIGYAMDSDVFTAQEKQLVFHDTAEKIYFGRR